MKQIFYIALAAGVGAAIAVVLTLWAISAFAQKKSFDASGNLATYGSDSSCNTLGIQVHGALVASRADVPLMDTQPMQLPDGTSQIVAPGYTVANEIEDTLRNASKDDSIKALLVDVDSPGGGVVAGQEIANAIRKSGKYSVAVIHEMGDSAGYLSAAAANKVYAGRNSDVGSIGVTASFLNQAQKNARDGVVYEILSSGKYKDMYSPDKPITADERALILKDVQSARNDFVQLVAEYRNMSYAEVDKLADGSSMLGKDAVKVKLVDAVGTTWDALADIEAKIGEPVSLCWQ